MQSISLTPNVTVLQAGSNIGLIHQSDHYFLIDSGMDKDIGKDILISLALLNVTPTDLIITHAHADHFGGASYLSQKNNLRIYATPSNIAAMQCPLLEPLSLFGGAFPPKSLQHKFLLAKPLPVVKALSFADFPLDCIALPGHTLEQVGIFHDGVFFAADACLSLDIIEKHPIPFCVDIERSLETYDRMEKMLQSIRFLVLGHGAIYSSQEEMRQVIDTNRKRLRAIVECIELLTQDGNVHKVADIIQHALNTFHEHCHSLSAYVLVNTTIHAALSCLNTRNIIQPVVVDNILCWQKV